MPAASIFIGCSLILGLVPILFGFEPLVLPIAFAGVTTVVWIVTPSPAGGSRLSARVSMPVAALVFTSFGLFVAIVFVLESRDIYKDIDDRLLRLCRAGLERYGRVADQEFPIRYFPRVADSSGDPLLAAFSRHCKVYSLEYVIRTR